jgi:hypothetical protein
MKNDYRDLTGRTLTFRFRANRSDTKQLSFYGPLNELDVALADAKAMIQALPADAVAEPAASPKGKSGGKGGKGKSGKGEKWNPPLVPTPPLPWPPWYLAAPPGLHADPVDTRDQSPQVAARDLSPQVAARDRSPQAAARDRSPSQSSSPNDSTQLTCSASPSADVGASCSAAQPPRSSTTTTTPLTEQQPACLLACLPACLPARLPACLPACLAACRVRIRSPSPDKQRL